MAASARVAHDEALSTGLANLLSCSDHVGVQPDGDWAGAIKYKILSHVEKRLDAWHLMCAFSYCM